MRIFIFTCILLCGSNMLPAQTDTAALLNEATSKLKSATASVSGILTDKSYLALHPNTSFRELIKKYSTASILQITTADEPGKKIKVTGNVKSKNGQPVANALVYLYQTDARGWYAADAPHVLAYEGDIRHARLFGYVKTNKEGKFELHTVKPSGYPRSDLPAHIHVHVIDEKYLPYETEFLFDDDERLVGNIREQSIRNHFLIAKPEKSAAPFVQHFSYTIEVQPR